MSAQSQAAQTVRQRLEDLHDYLRQGRILEAMEEFYADEVVMEEPAYGATHGLAANIEREKKFVESVKEFKNFQVLRLGVSEDASFYENVMDWIDVEGNPVHVEQVSAAEWRDGKIVRERFYYNMS